ncbi:hypothetical protein K440DRAFT_628346 [Wilcoxina mikolae CBS 423.85]|nr:hypothetical protein K440DRAFT_628346 [Wilcoxina mikolae CBS 423.85]
MGFGGKDATQEAISVTGQNPDDGIPRVPTCFVGMYVKSAVEYLEWPSEEAIL